MKHHLKTKLTILTLFLFGSLFLSIKPVLAAPLCFCYFGEKNDCLPTTVKDTDLEPQCITACQNDHKADFKNASFSPTTFNSITLEASCTAAHSVANPEEIKIVDKGVLPELGVKIPGVTFTPILEKNGYLEISFLADYISGVYKYLIGFSILVAVVFLMIGGLQWSLGAVSKDQITKAKKRIVSALIGLVLLVFVVLILETINPQLTLFNPIRILKVKRIEAPPIGDLMNEAGENLGNPGEGTTEVLSVPGEHKSSAGPEHVLSDAEIKQAANLHNIDECFLWAFAKKESGGKLLNIGHDENYNHNNKPVGSRKDFLMSGKKYNGAGFNKPTAGAYDYTTMNSFPVFNNDHEKFNNPPDYGLDWNYSHGIGYIQLTIRPNGTTMGQQIMGPNGPEWARKVRGKWFTISDLLNADTALEASIRFFGPVCGTKSTVVEANKCARVSAAATGRAIAKYEKCPLHKGMTISEADKRMYPATASH